MTTIAFLEDIVVNILLAVPSCTCFPKKLYPKVGSPSIELSRIASGLVSIQIPLSNLSILIDIHFSAIESISLRNIIIKVLLRKTIGNENPLDILQDIR